MKIRCNPLVKVSALILTLLLQYFPGRTQSGSAFPSQEIAPDGTWTWFNDERAIWHEEKLYLGYVMHDGQYGITQYDPGKHEGKHTIISTAISQEKDDHNNPSITILPDQRLMLVYAKHNTEAAFYYRVSNVVQPAVLTDWGPERKRDLSLTGNRNTYANTYCLSDETHTIYSFHRNLNFNPTLSISRDLGRTWEPPRHFLKTGSGAVRPYPKYTTNHKDRIDLIYTDGHPRNEENAIYHLYYEGGTFWNSAGERVKSFEDLPIVLDAEEKGTAVYVYHDDEWGENEGPDDWIPAGRAWTWDVAYQENGYPVAAFQVGKDYAGGEDFRNDRIYYYYARWTGKGWQKRYIANGGRPLYFPEDDYGGGMAIDPENPHIVYISTNAANPFDLHDIANVALNAEERYEIWKGETSDEGLTFTWTPITQNSTQDNLRPIVPENHSYATHVVWFQGRYTTYKDFQTRILGVFQAP